MWGTPKRHGVGTELKFEHHDVLKFPLLTMKSLYFPNENVVSAYHNGKQACKSLRTCYKDMINALQSRDEEACIEDASIGASTMMVYFKALTQYCGEFIHVISSRLTFEGRHLYEVVLHNRRVKRKDNEELPVIVVDAGQAAGAEPVEMALYLIEQLVACGELEDMISKAKWVIMPCTNPDGLEYSRFFRPLWRKNTRISADGVSYGVDITRNFDIHWDVCQNVNGFSAFYPGSAAAFENETKFITEVLTKHKSATKAYLSIRRDGHAIMYPHAFKNQVSKPSMEVAANIAAKVNQRGSVVQAFVDDSIFNVNGKAHCGHSVDYAIDLGIMLAFEMRVFHSNDLEILSKFQTLPKGYRSTLRNSYFMGIKELYNNITTEKRKNRG